MHNCERGKATYLNETFAKHASHMPALFASLIEAGPKPVGASGHPTAPGIYLLVDAAGKIRHVGRTRNLRQRLRAHRTPNHNSASFAFRLARRELGIAASYTKANSRAALQADETFGACFRRHVAAVSNMTVRFLPVPDPIDQYLLELYAVLELGMPADEFDTH
jgi:predicted GIY-YIG superfamily endonuclease